MRFPHQRPQFQAPQGPDFRHRERDGDRGHQRPVQRDGESHKHSPPRSSFGGGDRPSSASRPSTGPMFREGFRPPFHPGNREEAGRPGPHRDHDGRPPMGRDGAHPDRHNDHHHAMPPRGNDDFRRPEGRPPMKPPVHDAPRERKDESKARPETPVKASPRSEQPEKEPAKVREESPAAGKPAPEKKRNRNEKEERSDDSEKETVKGAQSAGLTQASPQHETAPPAVALAERLPLSDSAVTP